VAQLLIILAAHVRRVFGDEPFHGGGELSMEIGWRNSNCFDVSCLSAQIRIYFFFWK
jgi:hypothetical protein